MSERLLESSVCDRHLNRREVREMDLSVASMWMVVNAVLDNRWALSLRNFASATLDILN